MKKFIYKIAHFFFIIVAIIFIVFVYYRWSLQKIHLPHNITTIISGDSHTQSAINDSILDNCINISQTSEHYLYTYTVLNLTIKNNPQIKRIILGVSYHSFGKAYDKNVLGEKSKFMYSKYFSILDKEALFELYPNNANNMIIQIPNVVKSVFKSIISTNYNQYPFYGAFYKSQRSNINDSTVNKAIQRHYYNQDGEIQKKSHLQIKYLHKIINLCNNSNVELILINTPVSKIYKEKIPKEILLFYYSLLNKIKGNALIWDYNDLPLEDKCYGDGDHINYLGAEVISNLIKNKIIDEQVRTYNKGYKNIGKNLLTK